MSESHEASERQHSALEPAGALASAPEAPLLPAGYRGERLVKQVEESRGTVYGFIGFAVALAIAAILCVVFLAKFRFTGGWFLGVKGVIALATILGVKAAAKAVRKSARQLPDPEALALLRPLAENEDETIRQVAAEAMKGLNPEGTEVAAADAPSGTGSELSPAERAEPRRPTPSA